MKLNNSRQIRAEDFEGDLQEPMAQLGSILNSFMQEVVELSDGRIDFENMVGDIKNVEFTVDSEGKPRQNSKISVGVSRPRAILIGNAINLTNPTASVSASPFMAFSVAGNGVVEVSKITGLIENNKYRLTILIY